MKKFTAAFLLLSTSALAFASTSKSAQLSVVVDGYIDLPAIQNIVFSKIEPATVQTAQSIPQNYDIETDYDPMSSTPNVRIVASANYNDSTGAYMTDDPTKNDIEHKLYYTVDYHSCGDQSADYPLVTYDGASVFPSENIPSAQATEEACATNRGILNIVRLGRSTSTPYPSGGTYRATLTLTAQPAGA